MLDKEMRLQALREFTDCFYHVWSWRLDRFFNVLQSDCPHESLIRSVFLRDGRPLISPRPIIEPTLQLMPLGVLSRLV